MGQRSLVYARAHAEHVLFVETYSYREVMARNPSTDPDEPPRGAIEVLVPFDGHEYFTRQAYRDVVAQEKRGSASGALIGHLALNRHERTDLRDVLNLVDSYGSIPLIVPLSDAGITHDQLQGDNLACRAHWTYIPLAPEVVPVDVVLAIIEPQACFLPRVDSTRSVQQVDFKRGLQVFMRVRVHLDGRTKADKLNPTIRRLSLKWPTITSLDSLLLYNATTDRLVSLTYNPLSQSLEWSGGPMSPASSPSGNDVVSYSSEDMCFSVAYPGELYQEEFLDGEVEVEIPGWLASGARVRQFDATGRMVTDRKPELLTVLKITFRITIADAFRAQVKDHYQYLHFDEMIPDPARVDDIRNALEDRGFVIDQNVSVPTQTTTDSLSAVIAARRPEGAETMELSVTVEGRKYQVEQRTEVPGGQTFTRTINSGELKLIVQGSLRYKSQPLVHEMNALHLALRDRFERVRAER